MSLPIDLRTNTSTLGFGVDSMAVHIEALKRNIKDNADISDLTHDIEMMDYLYSDMVKQQSQRIEETFNLMQSTLDVKDTEIQGSLKYISSLKSIIENQQETLAELNSFVKSMEGQNISAQSILDTINNT
jgi:hypothetical protein